MGRSPCCAKKGLNKGAWNAEEDRILTECIKTYGEGKWRNLPQRAGLKRCGKSCRLRWLNYLKPDIKRGNISPDEEDLIIRLHKLLGNRWSLIAGRLPGRTDNEIKNYWNSKLAKRSITPSISEPSERSCVNNIEAKNATTSLAIRTKARKFSKKLSDLIPPNDDDVLKSTPQSTFNPLITQLDHGNNGEGHDLDVAEDDLGLDLLKFTFDDLQACDDGAKGEITHDLCLDLEYHLADQGETTLNWMEKHLLEDGNTIDSGFLDCLIENEEWLT